MEWLHAGRVGRPHGLDGSFHVTQPNVQLLANAETVMIDDRPLETQRDSFSCVVHLVSVSLKRTR